jgi:hypothetical protein
MTKPNDFILNSDYLSIAQVSSNTYTVNVATGTLAGNSYTEQDFNFKIRTQKGASDRIMINKDSGRYYLGSYRQINPATNVYGFIQAYRTDADTLHAKLVLENYNNASSTYPAMTFSIKVTSFRPPNVF